MCRFCLALFLSLFSFVALAECVQYQVVWRGEPGPWSSSKEAACSAINGKSYTSGTGTNASTLSVSGAFVDASGNCSYKETTTYASPGTAPYVFDTSSSILRRTVADCTETSCASQSGKDTTINWTLGYTRSSVDADKSLKFVSSPAFPPADGVICDPTSSCQMALVLDATAGWRSASPTSEGLYRVSVDYSAQHLGKSCTPSAADNAGASPSAEKPKCPGAVGEVNGVLGCYGTASSPTRNDVPSDKPAQTSSANPAAGQKPTSGPGSGNDGPGRTPTNGDGGPAGGPAGAAGGTGTKPDGTTPKPGEGKEQANCGAPGQPKCQIDESGTPSGSDSKDKLLDAVNKAADEKKAAIESASKLKADGWTFTFALPSGCSALSLTAYQIPGQGALSLDVCKWQPVIHDIMSMVWLICTVWGCINMVGATQRGS